MSAATMNPTMSSRDWLLLLVLSVLWGGSFFFVEVALDDLGPLTVVAGRVGLAAGALIALVYLGGGRMPGEPRLWGAFLVMGALNNLIPFSLIAWGQVHIDSGLASILNATTPLFTVILAHFLTAEERLTPGRLAGVLLGLCGVAVLIGPDALSGLGVAGLGQIAVLVAALSYAFAGIFGRRFKDLPPAVAAAGMLTATTVMILPLALVVERPWTFSPSGATWSALLGLALLSTAVAYQIYFRILASAGATNLLLVTFLIPVSALLLGVVFLGERPDWTAFAGMALIFAGLGAVDGRLLSYLWRRSSDSAAAR
jgi:drug/metabolite transporter (DMT)-like permease